MTNRVKSLVRESGVAPPSVKAVRVDLDKGIIYGAKFLGKISLNKRRYSSRLIKRKHKLYENANVYLNHDYSKKGRARQMEDWGGVIRATRVGSDEEGYCDIHCLKETPAGRLLLEAAVKFPKNFGLSPLHVVEAVKGLDGWEDVEDILEVRSVDVVTRPATTKSLHEENQMADDMGTPAVAAPVTLEDWFASGTAIIMSLSDYDDAEKLAMTKDLFKLKSKFLGGGDEEEPAEGEGPPAADEAHTKVETSPSSGAAQVRPLRGLKRDMREIKLRLLCSEAQIPVDDHLLDVLLPMDDKAVAAHLDYLKKQRRRPYASGGPRSGARTSGIAAEEVQGNGARSGARGQKGKAPPLLSAGAKREDVLAHYRSRN